MTMWFIMWWIMWQWNIQSPGLKAMNSKSLAWATASGTLVAVARMLATRRAANYYAKSTGHLPPGVAGDA